MAKGRRRWTVRLVLLGALVWLLGWQGLGWLSGPGGGGTDETVRATDEPERGEPSDRPGGEDPGEEPGETGVGQADVPVREEGGVRPSDDEPRDDPVPAPEGSPAPAGETVTDFAGEAAAGGEDHVRALFRLTRQAAETGMLGGGFLALDELDGLPIAAARREESQQARAALAEHLEEGITQLRSEIVDGRLLAARRRLGDLLQIPHTVVARALDELARSRDWPPLRGRDAARGYVPEPRPLPQDRFVRFYRNGIEVRARTVDCTAAEVTVHLRDERGVTYPSLGLTRIELPEATAAEAAEMGLAALRAGDVLLARLWLCLGLERGGSPRCRELAEALG